MSRLWEPIGADGILRVAISWAEVQTLEELAQGTRLHLRGGREITVPTPYGVVSVMFQCYLHDYASKP